MKCLIRECSDMTVPVKQGLQELTCNQAIKLGSKYNKLLGVYEDLIGTTMLYIIYLTVQLNFPYDVYLKNVEREELIITIYKSKQVEIKQFSLTLNPALLLTENK
uniref:Uncharacterized protein n=1 Tax=Glossina brevipalpis TaxID=37001 RepID=A0A1A9WMH8_9MUSC